MTGQVQEGTDRFTMGLLIAVVQVLTAHGYGATTAISSSSCNGTCSTSCTVQPTTVAAPGCTAVPDDNYDRLIRRPPAERRGAPIRRRGRPSGLVGRRGAADPAGVCASCPGDGEGRLQLIETRDAHGTWGGTSAKERQALCRAARRATG
jgi:hypothetical protein